ncbi:MAG TPA: hypothetical protein VM493_07135 [Vicinamibacterales bacterium]|nr:hypothetical protein [Vicinamibacterales bacterium]
MIKKIALGCGLALVLTGIVAAGLAYYAYRQVSSTFGQFAVLNETPELEKSVRNQEAYVPPPSEELTEAQVEKLVKVQADVRKRLGDRMAAFEAQYKALLAKEEPSLGDGPKILQAYADLASSWMDAKRAQVEALNVTGLSLEEYRWIRNQSYRALGQPFVDMDVSKIIESAKSGAQSTIGELRGSLGPDGPAANQERIARFKKMLQENLALASFGL